jgi:proteasome lid subunit RPN8/RPN11
MRLPRADRTGVGQMSTKKKREEILGLRQVSETNIYPHVFGHADREVGGVLVGRVAGRPGLPLITGAIAALSADEQRATITFTQDAWEHVHRTLDSEFPPEDRIVGWYHSHPGFGIFLSGHDLFIHRNFFNAPSQIAVVVDPRGGREGAFVWVDGDIELLHERDTPPGWAPRASTLERPPARHNKPALRETRYPRSVVAAAAAIGLLLGFGAWQLASGGGSPARHASPAATATHNPRGATHPGGRSVQPARNPQRRSE